MFKRRRVTIIRVLHIVGSLRLGGLESVAVNHMRYLDKKNFKFYYLVFDSEKGELEDEVKEMGAEILRIPYSNRNPIKLYYAFNNLLKANKKFDVVHSHILFTSGIIMLCAKIRGIPIRIVQSHTAQKKNMISFLKMGYQSMMRLLIKNNATDFLAVSKQSGEFLYGKQFFQRKGSIIYNSFDLEKFKFKDEDREEIRAELSLQDYKVLVHVGSLNSVKNQEFLIRVLLNVIKIDDSYRLVLIGEGENRENLEILSKNFKIEKYVIFLGQHRNVPKLLNAGDIFLFPSLYEGLGMALLEAQTSGLPCIISENIPNEALINDNIDTIKLNDIDSWVEAIISPKERIKDSSNNKIYRSNYRIENMKRKLITLYSKR